MEPGLDLQNNQSLLGSDMDEFLKDYSNVHTIAYNLSHSHPYPDATSPFYHRGSAPNSVPDINADNIFAETPMTNLSKSRSNLWTQSEIDTLDKAMKQIPLSSNTHISRCIRIAATLPNKSVRDVASQIYMNMYNARINNSFDIDTYNGTQIPCSKNSNNQENRKRKKDKRVYKKRVKKEPTKVSKQKEPTKASKQKKPIKSQPKTEVELAPLGKQQVVNISQDNGAKRPSANAVVKANKVKASTMDVSSVPASKSENANINENANTIRQPEAEKPKIEKSKIVNSSQNAPTGPAIATATATASSCSNSLPSSAQQTKSN